MSVCPRCGISFSCGMVDPEINAPCWCASLPHLPAERLEQAKKTPSAPGCFCPACLKALTASSGSAEAN